MTQMRADFSGRNAVETGAGGGMGLQITRPTKQREKPPMVTRRDLP